MSDLLTHVLVAFTLATVLSWHLPRFARRHVPLATVGAVIPDLAKVYMLTGDSRIAVFGVSGSWYALQTVGAVTVLAVAGAFLFPAEERRRVLAATLFGAWVHVGMDYLVIRAGDVAPPYLYPLTWAQLSPVEVYLSSSIWPSLVAAPTALAVWYLDRRRRLSRRATGDESPET